MQLRAPSVNFATAGPAQALQAVRADRQRWLSDAQQHARSLVALAEAVLRLELSREGRVWRANGSGGGSSGAGVAAAPAVDGAALTLQLGQASVELVAATEKASTCLSSANIPGNAPPPQQRVNRPESISSQFWKAMNVRYATEPSRETGFNLALYCGQLGNEYLQPVCRRSPGCRRSCVASAPPSEPLSRRPMQPRRMPRSTAPLLPPRCALLLFPHGACSCIPHKRVSGCLLPDRRYAPPLDVVASMLQVCRGFWHASQTA